MDGGKENFFSWKKIYDVLYIKTIQKSLPNFWLKKKLQFI